jgi:hypothetical protein
VGEATVAGDSGAAGVEAAGAAEAGGAGPAAAARLVKEKLPWMVCPSTDTVRHPTRITPVGSAATACVTVASTTIGSPAPWAVPSGPVIRTVVRFCRTGSLNRSRISAIGRVAVLPSAGVLPSSRAWAAAGDAGTSAAARPISTAVTAAANRGIGRCPVMRSRPLLANGAGPAERSSPGKGGGPR